MADICPTPESPVIMANRKTEQERKVLWYITYGEIGSAIGRAYIFGFLQGMVHLMNLWIDYMGYATMHYCQVMIMSFCGAIEVLMLMSKQNDGGIYESMINYSELTLIVYYVVLAFSATKGLACYKI